MNSAHLQGEWAVRFDWGSAGASALGPAADVAVVVDVLSFTTTLSVAADLGIEVLPYRYRDGSAVEYAAQHDAVSAVGRSEAVPGSVSLSPAAVRAARGLKRLVLPSPNGSSIAFELSGTGSVCVGACLRNASAVARWIATRGGESDASVVVIAAGERWPDGTLRPAVEDLWAAGAVLTELAGLRPDLTLSPEARTAAAAWQSVGSDVLTALQQSASGRELIESGYPSDVSVAAEVGTSTSVPVLIEDSFVRHR